MRNGPYFKPGQAVTADSFDHQKIIGVFHSHSNSFGVYVKGRPVGSDEPESLHKCLKLTLRHLTKDSGVRSTYTGQLTKGQPCTGLTKSGQKITGFFIQSEGKKAWIKGWPEGVSKFEPQQAFQVDRDTLKPS